LDWFQRSKNFWIASRGKTDDRCLHLQKYELSDDQQDWATVQTDDQAAARTICWLLDWTLFAWAHIAGL
jgi:hypothetical protein